MDIIEPLNLEVYFFNEKAWKSWTYSDMYHTPLYLNSKG